jgi:hypothetical protein
MNAVLMAAARWPGVAVLMDLFQPTALSIAHLIGSKSGVLAYEILTAVGNKYRIFSGEKSYMLAAIPAIHAALAIAEGRFSRRGVVPPTEHVDPEQLFDAARKEGIITIAG